MTLTNIFSSVLSFLRTVFPAWLWYVVAVITIGLGAYVFYSFVHSETDEVDERIEEEVRYVMDTYGVDRDEAWDMRMWLPDDIDE